jgi:hypothetical protein
MPRIKTYAVLLVVALFMLLPLYELADIGEHWPHDGDIVQIVLCVLFIVGLSVLCRGVACACLASLKRAWIPAPSAIRVRAARTIAPHDRSSLFLIFCDLRV